MKNKYNFSSFNSVFCDSEDALNWAYENGLPKGSIISTSSPKILFKNKSNIKHIEAKWTSDKIRKFQTSIEKFSIDIYKSIINSRKVSHEESLCASLFAIKIQNFLYKAACLDKEDLIKKILFIAVKGRGGRAGNFMNAPWISLLANNPNFKYVYYDLFNEINQDLTTTGVSKKRRFLIGGWETFFYRVVKKIYKILPTRFFKRHILIANENELIIESSTYLAMKGIKISKISPKKDYEEPNNKSQVEFIINLTKPVLRKRINKWIEPQLATKVENEALSLLRDQLILYYQSYEKWRPIIDEYADKNCILFINMPSSINGLALTGLCRKKNIKVVSMQHGVSKEINAVHLATMATYEINASDYFVAFNKQSAKASKKSYFSIGGVFISGTSNRLLRMSRSYNNISIANEIAYVSTNLYTANFGTINAHLSDYCIAKNEKDIIVRVLSKLPHKILYKTYPEENKRYPDKNPVLELAEFEKNIEVFEEVVDMRYFIWNFRIFITSRATSTLSWLVFSEKPVIFINWFNDNQLTSEAYNIFDKSIFVFNSKDKDFYNNLLKFLSKPIDEIELLYEQKKKSREVMIKEYFSDYRGGAGKRISKMVSDIFFKN